MHLSLKSIPITLISLALLSMANGANATCWKEASEKYGIPEDVLMAIAKTESGFNKDAKNVNKNGSTDIGLMQINSGWLPNLSKFDITKEDLATDACLNLKVGAWILSNNVKSLGWNWDAIGAYNVGCKKLSTEECQSRRSSYAWKIHSAMKRIAGLSDASPVVIGKKSRESTSVASRVAAPKIMIVSMNSVHAEVETQTISEPTKIEETQGFFFYNEEKPL